MLAITGSSGFIGSHICPYLPFPQKKLASVAPEFAILHENTSELVSFPEGNFSPFLEKASTLIHLACRSNPRNSRSSLLDCQQDLVFSTTLFEKFAQLNPQGHIIFASTGGNMYQTSHPFIPRSEKEVPQPASGYSIQKLAAEHYLRLICQSYGIRATVLRISNPYGTLLPSERQQGLIGIAMNKILNNEPLFLFDSHQSVRDYLHLDDLKEAFQCVIDFPPNQGEFRLFNVGSGIGYSLQDVLSLIQRVTGQSLIIKNDELALKNSPTWSVLSYELFHSLLGWKPALTLEEGLKKMWCEIRMCHQNDSAPTFNAIYAEKLSLI